MKYKVKHPDIRKTPSTVITCDGKVVWATPALNAWIGKDFINCMTRYRGAKWVAIGSEFTAP